MVICRQCGTANEDSESYCTNCGAKLPSPTPVAKDAETPAAVSRTVVTGPVIALPPESAGAAAVAGKPDGPVTQGAELPKARQPSAEDVKPLPKPIKLPPGQHPDAGDLICPYCGTGNAPTRTICYRCLRPLTAAHVQVRAHVPWWRRLLQRRPPPEQQLAGWRPRRKVKRSPRGLIALTVIALLGAAGWASRDVLMTAGDMVLDRVREARVNPRPIDTFASSAQRGHPAAHVTDGATNTYWAPARAGDGHGEEVEVRFEEPIRLTRIVIFGGISDKLPEFLEQARPHELRMTTVHTDGAVQTRLLSLKDQHGGQNFYVRLDDVNAVRFTIESAFGVQRGRRVAIGDVQFFKRDL